MKVKDIIDKIESTDKFRKYRKENEFSSLAHIFFTDCSDEIQAGYCNKDDTITSFMLKKDFVEVSPPQEIFKKPEDRVRKLDIDDIKIEPEQAKSIALELKAKKYKDEIISKKIIILQHLEEGNIYNITLVTASLKILNIKIDSHTGEVVHENLSSLMDLRSS